MAPSEQQVARLLRDELDGATVGYPSTRDLARDTRWDSREVGAVYPEFVRKYDGDVLDGERWSQTDGSQRFRIEVLDDEALNLLAEGVYENRPRLD